MIIYSRFTAFSFRCTTFPNIDLILQMCRNEFIGSLLSRRNVHDADAAPNAERRTL